MTHHKSGRSFLPLLVISLLSIQLLIGCASNITAYSHTAPTFDMATFFDGKLRAYGMVQDRSGKVLRRFEADLFGTWQGTLGKLEEDFLYDDGEQQRRVWILEKHSNGHYTGTADDVIGTASGQAHGFAFNWHYTLAVKVDGEIWNIQLNDWIYQLNETRLINRTEMTKWGFKVGEITLVIEKY